MSDHSRGRWFAIAAVMLCGAFNTAEAHLLPKQNATMNIVGKAAFFVVSVPVSALVDVDDDHNGLLSRAEMQRHTAEIQVQFERRFHVWDAGNPGTAAFSWLVPPQDDADPHDADYVIVLHRVDFAAAPTAPSMETDLFGTRSGEERMTITATRGLSSELAILEAGAASHAFFRGTLATFTDFARIGIEHIWGGVDHLLFLLTIVIAAAGWRYWLAVVTSFTVAHSITLTLSALDLVRIPSAIVEPGIALSIVAMALLNVWGGDTAARRVRRSRVGVVFACGLLHGFGFATAVGMAAVDTGSRIATLAGFNVGIELGQFAFVGAALLSLAVMTLLGGKALAARGPRFASAVAAVVGMVLLAQRVATG